jgi:hypothetical protein
MASKVEKWKGIIKTLFSPVGDTAKAEERMVGHMEKRGKILTKHGPEHTGGMFDIIFKKRKEREQTIKNVEG